MCLILFTWQSHPRYPLVVAANRDEFHDRPTAAAEFWQEAPDILAGRDLQAGGTWLGINRNGRFAAISNYREAQIQASELEYSRGHLVRDFLLDTDWPKVHNGRARLDELLKDEYVDPEALLELLADKFLAQMQWILKDNCLDFTGAKKLICQYVFHTYGSTT